MADLVFLVIVFAFFALCVGYVRVCDRIIGPDAAPDAGPDAGSPTSEQPREVVGR